MHFLTTILTQYRKQALGGLFTLILIASAAGAFFVHTLWVSSPAQSMPAPIDVQRKAATVGYTRQEISAEKGGTLQATQDTAVSFPAGFSDQTVSASHRELYTDKLQASNTLTPLFELVAKDENNADISTFNQPLTITHQLSDADLEKFAPEDIALYFFNTETKKWEKLESSVDPETKKLTAATTHFTVFVVAGADPNEKVDNSKFAEQDSLVVDDGDPEPYFIPGGQSDPDQPMFWDYTGTGYGGNSRFTYNSVNSTPHNWATWNVYQGLEGEQEVIVTIPEFNQTLTAGATYLVTHAGGTTAVTVDQNAARGSTVSLGTFSFNGSGSVYLNDVVAESGDFYLSAVVFDAVSFGGQLGELDLAPPVIEQVKAHADMGVFRIQAKVTDIGSGVAEVAVFYNGRYYPMSLGENDTYYASLPYSAGMSLQYHILATDGAGNQSIWQQARGYVSRGAFARQIGYYKGGQFTGTGQYRNQTVGACTAKCPTDQSKTPNQSVGDPINTLNGNLIERMKLLIIPGRPEIDFHITYNSQGGQLGLFGENWTHSYNYHVLEMDNPDFQGAFVQYPDGKVVTFSGPNFEPESGYYETFSKTADGYELVFTDLSKATFDAEGELKRLEDNNGNGITFEYAEKNPYTLISQLTSITADGGRHIKLSYNSDGLVQTVATDEGKELTFEYESDVLKSITDAQKGVTQFEYQKHLLTKKISPEGHAYYTNEYNDDGKVVKQFQERGYLQVLTYGSNITTVTDAHGFTTSYAFNDDKLLKKVIDPTGAEVSYTYTKQKELASITDQLGYTTEFEYDQKGNQTLVKDTLGHEIKRTYDQAFNKPVLEVYKEFDHTTNWIYDTKGNLTKVINAAGDSSTFEHNQYGQLAKSTDFNGNSTTFTYTPEGDIATVTDPEQGVQKFEYDQVGRLIKYTNARGNFYSYLYDKNDNILKVSGPLGFTLRSEYDKNNRLTKEFDANGGEIVYAYDDSENVIKKTNQLGFVTEYFYGPMNEQIKEISPEGHVTEITYDSRYLPTSITQAAGSNVAATTTFEYNARGEQVSSTDAEGRVTTFEYSPVRQLTKEVANSKLITVNPSEDNITTHFEYSPTGVLEKVTDANGNSTQHEYDALDRLVKKTDAENQVTEYNYDKNSQLVKLKNPRGFETAYEYDKNNRLKKIIDAKQGITEFAYDPNNNLEFITDANSIITRYTYNELDRTTLRTQNFVKGGPSDEETNVTTRYSQDPHGNLISVINPRGYATEFRHDRAHRNTAIIDALGKSAIFTYDKENNITQITDRNQHNRNFSYDELNRLTSKTNAEGHTQQFEYDKVGNILKFINERSVAFTHQYDPLNRVKVSTDPYEHTKSYTYDSVGNRLALTDENGHTDTFTYDKVYRLTSSQDAEGNVTNYSYDKNGNIIAQADAETNTTTFAYDELDRLISRTNAENETEEYAYDKTTTLTQKKEADGTLHTFEHDPLYRLATVINNYKDGQPNTNDTNVTTHYAYDKNGNVVTTTDPLSHATTFEFDPLDRLSKEVNPLGNTWQYTYDNERNLIARLDANGATTNYQYYPDDTLKKIVYPEYSVEYAYNETNFPTQMQDQLGATVWEYDLLDRLTKQTDPHSRQLSYEYDNVGNLKKLQYPDGRSMAHTYLKNDWLFESKSSDDDFVKYERNKVGAPVVVTNSNSTLSHTTYDKVYRPTVKHDFQVGGGNHLVSKFSYTYNDVGHITEEIAEYGWRQPETVVISNSYDGLHRLINATSDDDQSTQYVYDAAGNRTTLTEQLHQGPETRSYTYNAANQLTQIEIDSPLPPHEKTYTFQYDGNGNRTNKFAHDNTGLDRGTDYYFDRENRLTKAQDYQMQIDPIVEVKDPTPQVAEPTVEATPAPTPTAESTKTETAKTDEKAEVTDPVAEVKESTEVKLPEETVSAPATETTALQPAEPTLSRVDLARTLLEYDGNGRRLTSTYYPGASNPGKRTEFTFDRLDSVVEHSMWNGQRNNFYRTTQAPITRPTQPNNRHLTEFRLAVDHQGTDLAFFQEFKSEQDPAGTLYWYHYDGEGNIAATTKHSGQSDHTYRYDEYGTVLPDNGSGNLLTELTSSLASPTPSPEETALDPEPGPGGGGASGWDFPHNQYTINQKYVDPHMDLTYYGSRHYDAEVGTWLTQDKYRGKLSDPRTLHRYQYNFNSPVNYQDEYGFNPDSNQQVFPEIAKLDNFEIYDGTKTCNEKKIAYANTMLFGTTVEKTLEEKCQELAKKITERRNELAKREAEIIENPLDLPIEGPLMTVKSHQLQFEMKQRNLLKLLNEFNSTGCGSQFPYLIPADAWQYATKPTPETKNVPTARVDLNIDFSYKPNPSSTATTYASLLWAIVLAGAVVLAF